MKKLKIFIGADHGGYELREVIYSFLKNKGYEITTIGDITEKSCDYPDIAKLIAKAVSDDTKNYRGILICGTGSGMNITTNRHKGIRSIHFYGLAQELEKSSDGYEIIRLGRDHNNANILSLAGRFLPNDIALNAVEIFLNTPFSNEERHVRRINKID